MNNRNKTLLIFSPAFAANESESIWLPWLQIFIRSLNKNFSSLKIIVIAFQYPLTTQEYMWFNNLVIPFNITKQQKHKKIFTWVKIFNTVKKLKQKNDVIGIFSMWCGECTFVAKHISNFLDLRYFCWIVGQDARASNTYVKRIKPKASSLIAMSDFLADEFFKNHGIKPRHLVTNGVDISLFEPVPLIKDIDIIGVGSLSILQQYDIFIEVIAALQKKLPGIKAVLCGDGEAKQQIEEMIKDFSLGKNITLHGTVEHRAGLKMMQHSKILLHPSSYEGFSGVCLEALYAGAHVISFIKPMHNEIKNWHIVKNKNEMINKAFELLRSDIDYYPVLVYAMDDSAKKIMQLFDYA